MPALNGSFSAAGQSTGFQVSQGFNVTLSGTFSATVVPERSFDGGLTFSAYTYIDGSSVSWTAPVSVTIDEPEPRVLWRLNCTAYTSGTVTYRISD